MLRQDLNHPSHIPPPELFSTEVINLGPIVDPPFVDAQDWSQLLTPVEIRSLDFERREPSITPESAQQAIDVALASDRVMGELRGKRYEVMGVGSRSLDRQTTNPLVIIYNYADDVVVEAMVDATATRVLEVTQERYQPMLAASEERKALDLVREDGRLARAGIDVDTGTGLVVEEVNFRDPRHGHRLVDLRFGPANRRLPDAFAIVDLTAREILTTGLLQREDLS